MGWESMLGIGFDEIGEATITLKSKSGLVRADEGKVGKISADSEIGLCTAEDNFYGVIRTVDLGGGVSTVQRKGFLVDLPYTGNPLLGFQELVANGAGGVKPPATAGTGRVYSVVSIDATAHTLVIDLG